VYRPAEPTGGGELREALRLRPNNPKANPNLANVLLTTAGKRAIYRDRACTAALARGAGEINRLPDTTGPIATSASPREFAGRMKSQRVSEPSVPLPGALDDGRCFAVLLAEVVFQAVFPDARQPCE
jgi:hypothetical protein